MNEKYNLFKAGQTVVDLVGSRSAAAVTFNCQRDMPQVHGLGYERRRSSGAPHLPFN